MALSLAACTATPPARPPQTTPQEPYEPETNYPEPETAQADVIVVGGGMGGLVSAIAAAQEGASVILLEKMSLLGGSTMFGGGLSVADSRWQLEHGGLITPQELYDGWVNLQTDDPRHVGFYDRSLIRPMVDASGQRFDWLLDLGYEPALHANGRMLIASAPEDWEGWTGPLFVEFLADAARNLGVDIQMNTRGLELTQGIGGEVTGVIAQRSGGEDVIYNANSAVILATGGISRNPELMQRFLPQLAPFVQYSTAAPGHMGDGFIMAEAVGAVPHDNHWLIGLGLQNEFSGMLTSAVPGILVNQDGQRYVMETRPPGFIDHYTYIYNYTIQYAPGGAFFVFDSSEPFENRVAQIEQNADHPDAFKGETIEELAQAMGVSAETLKYEIDAINAVAAGQAQDRLGRTVNINPILEAPFYAMRVFPMDMGTIGGVITDDYYRVLDTDNQIIPGLLAVGEMSNRRYIAPMYFSGLSLMITLSQGIVAGQAAVTINN